MREEHQKVRNAEWKWRKYKQSHQWKNFKNEQKNYYRLVNKHKKLYISTKILQARGNPKDLYEITTTLCGDRKLNTLPEHTNDKIMADGFLDFFITKVETIRSGLEPHRRYDPLMRKIKYSLPAFESLTAE